MPEREDSIDSFDEFFGAPRAKDDRKKSSAKPKDDGTPEPNVSKTQSTTQRSKSPQTPEQRRLSSSKSKPKVNNVQPSLETNGHRRTSSESSRRPESIHSKVYDLDFDNDNESDDHTREADDEDRDGDDEYRNNDNDDDDDDDRETVLESKQDRNAAHSSLPPSQQLIHEKKRRGSDSELKSSFTTKPRPKPTHEGVKRRETFLPYIRPQQTRRVGYPIRRIRETTSSSTKTELEQRALSAQNNKIKVLESRLAELRRELENQRVENATLRTIQRREEKAIKKYEEKEYDIHKIVRDFTHEIEHMKTVLVNERETKFKLEQQIEAREEKLRNQTTRIKKYEKIVREKNLDERYELREKLAETDKKLQEVQEKLNNQEKYIEHLEKNHRHEITQELTKQRELKRQLEARSEKYNELLLKLEAKTRQVDTMHIYAQRSGKRSSVSPTDITKSRSLQSLNEISPRRDKVKDSDKSKRVQQEREKKTKAERQRRLSTDVSPKHEKNKLPPKKPSVLSTEKSTTQNGHLPPNGKVPARRLSTPKSVDEEKHESDTEDMFRSKPKKLPPPTTTNQRNDEHLSQSKLHKRPVAPVPPTTESKYVSTAVGGGTSSSIFKLTEPPVASKNRATRPLDEKWSEMFGSNEKNDTAKEDLLAKLTADEPQERRIPATNQSSSIQRPPMSMFESTTRPIASKPSTTVKPSDDPFESLFNNNTSKPTAARRQEPEDIFSTKPTIQSTTQAKNDPFESLFGPTSTNNDSTTTNSNAKFYTSQSDKLQRPKLVTNATKPTPNRTVVDELEEFVL